MGLHTLPLRLCCAECWICWRTLCTTTYRRCLLSGAPLAPGAEPPAPVPDASASIPNNTTVRDSVIPCLQTKSRLPAGMFMHQAIGHVCLASSFTPPAHLTLPAGCQALQRSAARLAAHTGQHHAAASNIWQPLHFSVHNSKQHNSGWPSYIRLQRITN